MTLEKRSAERGQLGRSELLTPPSAAAHDRSIAKPPARQGELARVAHGDEILIVITETRDRSRLCIETWTRYPNGWRLGGFVPTIPAILLDPAIEALQLARDELARQAAGR